MDKNRVTLEYSRKELDKYMGAVTAGYVWDIELKIDDKCLYEEGCAYDSGRAGIKYDPVWDDAYSIDIREGIGSIAGSNARSVLAGVYRFLYEIGCRFLRPGPDGEVIPHRGLNECTVKLNKIASYKHRGICIEGAVSLQNVLDMIEWAPKVGFNAYFIQFRQGHEFFERWYTHQGNEFLSPENYTLEQSINNVCVIVEEIRKRSMIYHAVGHGWTCECIGFPSTGWHKISDEYISEDVRPLLAMVNDKRTFFEGIPLNTHLCYSNPKARELMVSEIVRYATEHREVDILHLWLADNYNNVCECENCRREALPDLYVSLLNEIDARLTGNQIDTKIVFLIYYELLWTPEHSKLINEDRFIMMFAPITRTYTKSFLTDGKAPPREDCIRMDYKLNRVVYPDKLNDMLAFLYQWQDLFKGDSFDFDYHLMWDIYREYGNLRLAEIIHKDVAGLKEIGLNGLISCQLQRVFFPNGFPMYVMGRTLFERDISYEELLEEYFAAAYGKEASLAQKFLMRISNLFSHEYIRGELPVNDPGSAENFREAFNYISEMLPEIESIYQQLPEGNRCIKLIWKQLKVAGVIWKSLALILAKKAEGCQKDIVMEEYKQVEQYICSMEIELQPVLDVFFYNRLLKDAVAR